MKDPLIVHPTVLAGGPSDNRKSSNLRTVMTMMANPDGAGCVHMNVTEDAGGLEVYRSADISQCSIVSEYNDINIKLRPAAGGDTAWIKLTKHTVNPDNLPLGNPIVVGINVNAYEEQQDAWAYQGYGEVCE